MHKLFFSRIDSTQEKRDGTYHTKGKGGPVFFRRILYFCADLFFIYTDTHGKEKGRT